jgi:hypothetical protein
MFIVVSCLPLFLSLSLFLFTLSAFAISAVDKLEMKTNSAELLFLYISNNVGTKIK